MESRCWSGTLLLPLGTPEVTGARVSGRALAGLRALVALRCDFEGVARVPRSPDLGPLSLLCGGIGWPCRGVGDLVASSVSSTRGRFAGAAQRPS